MRTLNELGNNKIIMTSLQTYSFKTAKDAVTIGNAVAASPVLLAEARWKVEMPCGKAVSELMAMELLGSSTGDLGALRAELK